MCIIHKLFLMIFVLSIYSAVFAVEGEEKTKIQAKEETKMEEIVVTATKTEKDVESAPGDVSVITKKELEMRNIQSVDAALKAVPGVYSRRELEFSTLQPVINLRGISGQNRTLVLVDGITLNEPRTGAGYFDGLSVDNIQQIEVVKGPFSSLYGGYAMAGVVNVITRMPEKREFILKSGYGTSWDRGNAFDDLYNYYVSYGDRLLNNKLAVLVSYGRKETNGFPYQWNVTSYIPASGYSGYELTTDNTGMPCYLIGDKGDGHSWYDDITLKAQYDFSSAMRLGLIFLRNNYRTDYDPPHTLLINSDGLPVFSDGSKIREASYLATAFGRTRNIYNLALDTELWFFRTKLSVGLIDMEKSFNRTPGSTSATTQEGGPGTYLASPSREYFADLQFIAPLFSNQVLTWGVSYKRDLTDSTTYNLSNWRDDDSKTTLSSKAGGKTHTYAIFMQDEMQLLRNLTAYLGGRVDWWDTTGGYNESKTFDSRSASSFSPKASLVYKPFDTTTLRLSGGKSFRPPSVYELYSQYVGTYTLEPNPDLKPEKAWTWDVGVAQGLWQNARIKLTYFENYLEDLIYSQTINPALQTRVNVGKAKSYGIETEFEQRVSDWLRLFTDFTYTKGKVTDNPANPAIVGKKLVDMPNVAFNIGAEAQQGPVSGSLTGRYIGKRYSTDLNTDVVNNVYISYDPFFTADAKVSYKFTKFASLSFSVNNIFDRQYFVYYEATGRSWYTELTMRF